MLQNINLKKKQKWKKTKLLKGHWNLPKSNLWASKLTAKKKLRRHITPSVRTTRTPKQSMQQSFFVSTAISKNGNDAAALAEQAQMYEDALMACFFDNPGVCTAFLTWGFTDSYSWMNDRAGGDVYPLLYTDDYSEKPSYDALLTTL